MNRSNDVINLSARFVHTYNIKLLCEGCVYAHRLCLFKLTFGRSTPLTSTLYLTQPVLFWRRRWEYLAMLIISPAWGYLWPLCLKNKHVVCGFCFYIAQEQFNDCLRSFAADESWWLKDLSSFTARAAEFTITRPPQMYMFERNLTFYLCKSTVLQNIIIMFV